MQVYSMNSPFQSTANANVQVLCRNPVPLLFFHIISLCCLFGALGSPFDLRFSTNTSEHETDSEILHRGKTVAECDDRHHHRKHFTSDVYRHQHQRTEFRQRIDYASQVRTKNPSRERRGARLLTNENLSHSTAKCKPQDVHANFRM
jgi:hypothetical protein